MFTAIGPEMKFYQKLVDTFRNQQMAATAL